jgi:hypothetical protein
MLWPLLGWLELTPARWLWAATTVAALAWLVYVIARESGMETLLERMFVALLPLSMYATGAAIGNGQLIVHLLPALLAGLLLLSKRPCRWPGELLAAALGLGALVKPSVSVPFFWIVLFVPGRLRPVLLVTAGYVALTLFAASFQALGVLSLIQGWLVNASAVAVRGGHANLHIWLAAVGLKAWLLPASLLVLVALGCWITAIAMLTSGSFWASQLLSPASGQSIGGLTTYSFCCRWSLCVAFRRTFCYRQEWLGSWDVTRDHAIGHARSGRFVSLTTTGEYAVCDRTDYPMDSRVDFPPGAGLAGRKTPRWSDACLVCIANGVQIITRDRINDWTKPRRGPAWTSNIF